MSSKIKKTNGTERVDEKERKKQRQGRQITVFAIVLGLAIILGITGGLIWKSGLLVRSMPAITINGENYKLCEFNYYYYAYYNAYLDENSDYIGYMFDQSDSLKDQEYDENSSWFDYFSDQTVESMVSVLTASDQAKEEGYELSQGALDDIAAMTDQIENSAELAGITADQYLTRIYGSGMTADLYKEHLINSHLAAEYGDELKSRYSFSDEEVETYYKEHIQNYTFVNYERFYVKACDAGKEPTEEEKKNAENTANEILDKVNAGEDLKSVSNAYQDKGTYYSFDDAYYDKSFSYGDWLFSADRKEGDSNIIDDGAGFYVMVFHSRSESDYPSADIIDIHFPVDAASITDATELDEAYEASCDKAEDVYETWNAGDKTKESFVKLSQEFESESDGVFENVIRNELDSKLDSWIFDSERKPGDCAVVYTDGGFHTIYYTASGKEAWKVEAEADMRDEAYNGWYQDLLDSVKVKRHEYVMGFAGNEINK